MGTRLADLPRPERYAKVAASLITAGLCSIFFCLLAYAYFFHRHPIGETEDWGAFGAFISGVAGTALSAFTLAALAFTLALQSHELAESRELAKKQSIILEKQSGILYRQGFESTFFQLLDRFTRISNSLNDNCTLTNLADALKLAYGYEQPMGNLERLEKAYSETYENYEHQLGPYYRTFYHVIKFVDTAELNPDEKAIYISLARAQIGSQEVALLFINVVAGKEGRVGLKPLVEKYGLLKHAKTTAFPNYVGSLKVTAVSADSYLSRAERQAAHGLK